MASPAPLYTRENCRTAYQLNWVLSIFWHHPVDKAPWYESLQRAVEPDGVRILQHHFAKPGVSQFLLSTTPAVVPSQFVRSIKGRLQYLIRDRFAAAFRRNYGFRSVGSVTREVIENYVAKQVEHHPMADPAVQQRLDAFQIRRPEVDLSEPQRTSHAMYWYNLHVVFVHDCRYMEIQPERLQAVRDRILRVSDKRGFRLSTAGIVPDHVHLVLGCKATQAPADVALCYMNNLAYGCGMKRIYRFGFYVGTHGEYDLGVTWL